MAKFLTTRKSSSSLEDIIDDAKSHLVLISPFVKIPDTLFRCLQDADKKGVDIILVHGKKDLEPEVKAQLARLENITVRFLENLHAKCFYNEKQMVITSMNLYDFSEVNNEEMGILLNVADDASTFEEALRTANSIVNHAEKVKIKDSPIEELARDFKSITDSLGLTTQEGHCISCNSTKEFDTEKPLCKNCYPKWAKHKTGFTGEFCHKCGKRVKTTMPKPLCASCYNK